MITEARGNLLTADVEALVNTVNTVGIMGKGIALQFKRAYPAMFKDYTRAVKRGDVRLGRMHVWPTQSMTGPRYIINFPTKGHWRSNSRIGDIERGLSHLAEVLRELQVSSIAVPPLGCGHGGLDWAVVEPLIRQALASVDIDVRLYAPESTPAASDMVTSGPAPAMTPGRAALIELMARYTPHAFAEPSLIEAQKLMYFLQVAGEPLRLRFEANLYGPYADNLRHVLIELEGHYLSGYGDGSNAVVVAEALHLLEGARDAARAQLGSHPETIERIDQVLELIEGYESPYALELLATVHWVLTHGAPSGSVIRTVHEWSARKERMFSPEHILAAENALRARGWVAPDLVDVT